MRSTINTIQFVFGVTLLAAVYIHQSKWVLELSGLNELTAIYFIAAFTFYVIVFLHKSGLWHFDSRLDYLKYYLLHGTLLTLTVASCLLEKSDGELKIVQENTWEICLRIILSIVIPELVLSILFRKK